MQHALLDVKAYGKTLSKTLEVRLLVAFNKLRSTVYRRTFMDTKFREYNGFFLVSIVPESVTNRRIQEMKEVA